MPSDAIVIAAVTGSAGVGALVDLRTRRVPNWLTLSIAAFGISLAAAHLGTTTLAGAFGGLVVGLLLMLPPHVVGATGAGDVKLFAAVGTLLGPTRIGLAFLYTALAGGALAIVIAVVRGRLRQTLESTATLVQTRGSNVAQIENPAANNRFAYAPAIAIGAIVAAIGI